MSQQNTHTNTITAQALVSAPVAASRTAWVAWMRGDDTVPAELLLPAMLDEGSRDALLLYPHRGDWHHSDPTTGRTWNLNARELLTLGANGAPNEDLSNRILDGLGNVLDDVTRNDDEHATALAAQGFLAWDAENNAAALMWTAEALQHNPGNRLATILDDALHNSRLPLWRR
ncbi:hypothetical protein [Kineococcus sp. R86509]|uniref:hypothetical protein n=1 Tax=Kineococcus sp. R86509 TaxID=3093851 RepID=UPI0036D3187C